MSYKEETLKKEYIYKGKILNLRVDDAVLTNGKRCKREIIEHSGGAAVYAEKDNRVLFVKQYRYAYQKEIYEIPAGKINNGEDPSDTARRELEEECGYLAKDLTLMFKVYPTPGYTNEIIYIYKAKDLVKTKAHLDEGEFLTCEWIKKEEALKMLENGDINDAKTIIALLKA